MSSIFDVSVMAQAERRVSRPLRPSAITVTSAPTAEPLNLDVDVKPFLNLTTTDDDALLTGLMIAVRRHVEQVTRRALVTQTVEVWFDRVPDGDILELPRPPLQAVVFVKSYDTDNAPTTLSASHYYVDTVSEPGRIVLNLGSVWPTNLRAVNALQVQQTVGYGTPPAVPENLKLAMQRIIATTYEFREDLIGEDGTPDLRIPHDAAALLALERVITLS